MSRKDEGKPKLKSLIKAYASKLRDNDTYYARWPFAPATRGITPYGVIANELEFILEHRRLPTSEDV